MSPEQIEELRFREAMQNLRNARGWSQGELARRMVAEGWKDFHQATISRIEKGSRPVRLGEARAIARILDVPLSSMLAHEAKAEAYSDFLNLMAVIYEDRTALVERAIQLSENLGRLQAALELVQHLDVVTGLSAKDRDQLTSSMLAAEELVRSSPDQVLLDTLRLGSVSRADDGSAS